MTKLSMITTKDNPFNPFTETNNWQRWDEDHGYFTTNYLDRIAVTSDDLSQEDYINAMNHAVDEILEMNLTGNYIKVYETT